MQRFVITMALAATLIAPLAAPGAETPLPAAPARFVTDHAGLLSPPFAQALNARLAAYERGTGHQVLVYVDRTTGGAPIEDWAVRAFAKWRVGRAGIDDGAALFIFTGDRRMRIEVGYGLEDRVPDAVAKRIIDERIAPRLRAGDGDGAVRAGVDGLLAALGGAGAAGPERTPARVPGWVSIVVVLLFIGLIGVGATHPSLAAWLLFTIVSGRGRGGGFGGGGFSGGGGFGGGGFSGGGGRSGGGGASGSW